MVRDVGLIMEKTRTHHREGFVPAVVGAPVGAELLGPLVDDLVFGRVRQLADLGRRGQQARHEDTVAVEDEAVVDEPRGALTVGVEGLVDGAGVGGGCQLLA